MKINTVFIVFKIDGRHDNYHYYDITTAFIKYHIYNKCVITPCLVCKIEILFVLQ